MKATECIDLEPVAIPKRLAIKCLGNSRALLQKGEREGRIKPVVQGGRGRASLYDLEEVCRFWNSLKSERGFTLVELLGVVAVVAILAAIAITSISGAVEAARIASIKANARILVEHADRARSLGYEFPWLLDSGGAIQAIQSAADRLNDGIETPVGTVVLNKHFSEEEIYEIANYIGYTMDGEGDRLTFIPDPNPF